MATGEVAGHVQRRLTCDGKACRGDPVWSPDSGAGRATTPGRPYTFSPRDVARVLGEVVFCIDKDPFQLPLRPFRFFLVPWEILRCAQDDSPEQVAVPSVFHPNRSNFRL